MEYYNNTTTHSNHSNGTSNTSDHNKAILKWISFVIFLGIIAFNTLVIVLLLSRKKKTRMGFFVTNLAIADLCLGLFFVFPELVFSHFGVPWNKYVCYIVYAYFSQFAVYVSIYAIVVLSIDRLYVIVRPLSAASKGQKYRFGLASAAWIIGALLAIQYVVHIKTWKTSCFHIFPYREAIIYIDASIIIVIPVIIIVICYTGIIITICRREKRGFVPANRSDTASTEEIISKNKVISSAKIKTIKLLLVVVCVYILCWTPIFVDAFLQFYGNIGTGLVYKVLYTFAPLNSFANPLVFLIFNFKMFRSNKKKTDSHLMHMNTMKTSLGSKRHH
ncbi:cardioacceleratory peptide receptor-like [Mytilus californianus]|uniref:cardioacceleratory peptide receptor-like n=1 Tax=Mytilus californianus TaxID=6549 RepID=UPI002247DB4A|nr:cardioacceleratory peptide receptor-like [Mytilus californianus]